MMVLQRFLGKRIVKTGLAVFFTALICEFLNWPPVFAVITAIVTIEPTVADSIKKGMVRFPASAIGSAYAVLFISLFGNSPLTYMLAAVLTIATCSSLKLHDGLLVATLTSVAMVEVIHDHFLISFFIRLGTTTIGLGVSTLVNMFILPPDYRGEIKEQIQQLVNQTSLITKKVFHQLMEGKQIHSKLKQTTLPNLEKKILKTEGLIRFQKEESKYHPLTPSEQARFQLIQKQLKNLRLIHEHLDNLVNTPIDEIHWTQEEQKIIVDVVENLCKQLLHSKEYNLESLHEAEKQIIEVFIEDNEEIMRENKNRLTKFPPKLIVLYEFISVFELVVDFIKNRETQL